MMPDGQYLQRSRFELLDARTAFFAVTSVFSTVGIVLVNKIVLGPYNFPFPIFLTGCHFLVNAFLAAYSGLVERKSISVRSAVVTVGVGSLAMGLSNICLQYNSIAAYQCFKLLCAPLSALTYSLCRVDKVSLAMFASLLTVIAGAAFIIVTEHNLQITLLGSLVGCCTTVALTMDQVLFGEVARMEGVSGMELQRAIILYKGCSMMVFSFFVETRLEFPIQRRLANVDLYLLLAIATTCVFAFAINMVGTELVCRTSATTYQLLGSVKTILTTISGWFYFAIAPDVMLPQAAGVCVATLGLFNYLRLKRLDINQRRKEV